MKESPRDRVRRMIFFTPWLSVPLSALGVMLAIATPLVLTTSYGWVCYPVAVALALALALWLRPRYRLAILDSSHLGVFYWLQRR